MTIRKLLALILTLAAALSLFAGCGEEKAPATTQAPAPTDAPAETTAGTAAPPQEPAPEGYITTKEAFLEKMESLLDMSLYHAPDVKEASVSIDIKERISYDFDYAVKLNGNTSFTMPCTYADLEKQGWTGLVNADQEVDANAIASVPFGTITGHEVRIDAYNASDKTVAFQDCQYIAISYEMRSRTSGEWESNAPTFTVCDTITENSTLEDVIAVLGMPSNAQYYQARGTNGEYLYTTFSITFAQKDGNGHIRLEFSGDTGNIVAINYDSVR